MKRVKNFLNIFLCFSIIFAVIAWLQPLNQSINYFFTNNIEILLNNRANATNTLVKDKKYTNNNFVYLGGQPYGFLCKNKGAMVIGKNILSTKNDDNYDNIKNNELQYGDVIQKINDTEINCSKDIIDIINQDVNKYKNLKIEGIRKNKKFITNLKPTYDIYAKKYKLGIWTKDKISGIGTVTYINPNNKRFGALGHPLTSQASSTIIPLKSGKVYSCNIIGIKKAKRGHPGGFQGIINSTIEKGEIDKNTNSGLFGFSNNLNIKQKKLIEVGSRNFVKPGKAYIYTTIDGKNVQPFEIEIIKTNFTNPSNNKNLVFRVVDKKLINQTGGIVQGMSGSPIVQNNKLIGAVTHVFINDATKAFGIFIDNMILN